MKPAFFVVLSLIFMLSHTPVAHAGFLSFIEELFLHNKTMTFERGDLNSQTAEVLRAAVNPDPNPSKGGGDITVVGDSALLSDTGPSGTVADLAEYTPVPKSGQISVYVVRPGDSLSQIAKMFGVSVNTIRWANDIGSKGVIHEGQTLVILPVSGLQYTVKKGDTLASIAKEFKGDIDEILSFNGLTSDSVLAVGDTIVIPGGSMNVPAAVSSSRSGVAVNEPAHDTNGPDYDGYYIWPVDGGVKTQGLHGYNGIDIGAPKGTPVFAAASGKVIVSRYRDGNPWFGGYGNYIVVEHDNGTQTLYAHLSQTIVSRGWNVVQGQVIGYVGSTGRSTGPHLHFEVRGARNPFR